jgi:uroporphyrinogen III methyltransferase/synthase
MDEEGSNVSQGRVYLVGAGPGDPRLLTLRGEECLARADVVLYDALVHEGLLEHAPRAERIFVGKRVGETSHSQHAIEEIMIRRALEGKQVVRLKGGDPFLFGRGGEEAEHCVEAGIDFEVIPGVSSALAVPAYAGIPLTHRDLASSVSFVTAHEARGKKGTGIPWRELSKSDTLVVFMGVGQIENIAIRLIEEGKSPDTPVALIRWGTRPEQETLVGDLGTIAGRAKECGFTPPTLIVIGDVVRLRQRLRWFEKKPLFGKRILVTRSRNQARELIQSLERLGAEAISLPTIEIRPLQNTDSMDRILDRLGGYDWIIFTSVNAVDHFTQHLFNRGHDLRDLREAKIIARGPETAKQVRNLCLRVDRMPEEFHSEGILKALAGSEISAKRFLIPRAQSARDIIPETLRQLGADVDVVEAYQTLAPEISNPAILQMLEEEKIHWVTFTSSSTVRNFLAMIPDRLRKHLRGVQFACIGPVTAGTLRACGFHPHAVPKDPTVVALVDAIAKAASPAIAREERTNGHGDV